MDEVVGIFYEKPDGTIVQTYGFNDFGKTVLCYCYKMEPQEVSYAEFKTWKPRADLIEFPGCDDDDKSLPYVFDLLYDIKTRGDLKRAIREKHNKKRLLALMDSEGVAPFK